MKEKRAGSLTWHKVDAMTDKELDAVIAADDDECGFVPDWTKAELVLPESKLSVNLGLIARLSNFSRDRGGDIFQRCKPS